MDFAYTAYMYTVYIHALMNYYLPSISINILSSYLILVVEIVNKIGIRTEILRINVKLNVSCKQSEPINSNGTTIEKYGNFTEYSIESSET